MIGIVNYGSGNIQAIVNIYNRLNIPSMIVEDSTLLNVPDKLILPGVGSFDETMQELTRSGMKDELNDVVLNKKKPILGICVGMQILADRSDEGQLPGLGWIKGSVKKFDTNSLSIKPYLPHMGWNTIEPVQQHPILNGLNHERGFYFVHSYYFDCANETNVLAQTSYGNPFSSAVIRDTIFGMQFHPEKSHSNGVKVLGNFAKL